MRRRSCVRALRFFFSTLSFCLLVSIIAICLSLSVDNIDCHRYEAADAREVLDGSVLGSGSDMGMGNDTYVRVSTVSPSSDEEGSGLSEPSAVPRKEPLRGGGSSLDPASDAVTIDISPAKSPPGAEAAPPGWPRRRVCYPPLPFCVSLCGVM